MKSLYIRKPYTRLSRYETLAVLSFLYFLQGMPYGIQIKILPILLRTYGVSLTHISLFKLLFLPWALKVLWAPFVDSHGTKKQWLQTTLMILAVICALTSLLDLENLTASALMLFAQNVIVSVQDISVDAFAVSALSSQDVGLGNVAQVVGYKLGGVLGGALYLILYQSAGHSAVYAALTLIYAVAAMLVFITDTQSVESGLSSAADGQESRADPKDFPYRQTLLDAIRVPGTGWMIAYSLLYKCGENGAISLLPLYLLDKGVSQTAVAFSSGLVGSITTIVGSALGGYLLQWGGTYRLSCILNVSRLGVVLLITVLLALWPNFGLNSLLPGTLLVLFWVQLFLSGLSSIFTFSWMMLCSQTAPSRLQSTHFTSLATSEILGKLLFAALSGFLVDVLGYFVAFTIFILLSAVVAAMTFRSPACVKSLEKKDTK